MSKIAVIPTKPSAEKLRHPVDGLLDAAGNVPAEGRAWLYDGFTCSLLVTRAVIRADDPIFAVSDLAPPSAAAPPAAATEPASPPPAAPAPNVTPGPSAAPPSAAK